MSMHGELQSAVDAVLFFIHQEQISFLISRSVLVRRSFRLVSQKTQCPRKSLYKPHRIQSDMHKETCGLAVHAPEAQKPGKTDSSAFRQCALVYLSKPTMSFDVTTPLASDIGPRASFTMKSVGTQSITSIIIHS